MSESLGYDEAPYSEFEYNGAITFGNIGISIVDVTEVDGEWYWYTRWFGERKITGDENKLSAYGSGEDAYARVKLQYDGRGDGTADAESEFKEIGETGLVQDFNDIPITEDGRYRMVLTDYTGNATFETINMGLI